MKVFKGIKVNTSVMGPKVFYRKAFLYEYDYDALTRLIKTKPYIKVITKATFKSILVFTQISGYNKKNYLLSLHLLIIM